MPALLPIDKISFGIRFGPSYKIGDNIGSIVDAILRGKGTSFGPKVFPMSQARHHGHRLLNPETADQLIISERELILIKGLKTRGIDEVVHLSRQFVQNIVSPVKNLGKIRDIHRYGMLFELAECATQLEQSLTKRYLAAECPNARSLTLQFNHRLSTDEAHFRKGVDDYKNILYILQQDEDGASRISIDYQEYFQPALDPEDWKKKSFENFSEAGASYFVRSVSKWLKGLLSQNEAA